MPFAADPALSYVPPAAAVAPDPFALLLKLLALTAVCLVLCGVVVWLARRKLNSPAAANGRIVLTGSLPLDRRSAVHLLSVDGTPVAVTTDAGGLRGIQVLQEDGERGASAP